MRSQCHLRQSIKNRGNPWGVATGRRAAWFRGKDGGCVRWQRVSGGLTSECNAPAAGYATAPLRFCVCLEATTIPRSNDHGYAFQFVPGHCSYNVHPFPGFISGYHRCNVRGYEVSTTWAGFNNFKFYLCCQHFLEICNSLIGFYNVKIVKLASLSQKMNIQLWINIKWAVRQCLGDVSGKGGAQMEN